MSEQAKSNKLVVVLAVVVIVVLGLGYLAGTSYRKTGEKAPGVSVEEVPESEIPPNVSRGKVTDETGGFELERGGLRAFPRNFPTYQGALVASSWDARSAPAFEGITVVWESDGGVSDVASHYKKVLTDADWEISEDSSNSDPATMVFEKEQTKLHFWIGESGGVTAIQITAAGK